MKTITILYFILLMAMYSCQTKQDLNRVNRHLFKNEIKQNVVLEAFDFFSDSAIMRYSKESKLGIWIIPFENANGSGIVVKYQKKYYVFQKVVSESLGCCYVIENPNIPASERVIRNDTIAINSNNRFELLISKSYFSGRLYFSFVVDSVDVKKIRICVYCFPSGSASNKAENMMFDKSISSWSEQVVSIRDAAKISEFKVLVNEGKIVSIEQLFYKECDCQSVSLLNCEDYHLYNGQYISSLIIKIIAKSFYPHYYWD